MNHLDVQDLLSAHANGELSRTQREFVEEHLGSCADCRAALAEYTWVRSRVTSLRATHLSSDIREATMLKIDAIGTMRRPVQGLLRPALAAAAVVVAAIAVSLVLQLSGATPGGPIARAYAATEALESFRMSGTTVSSFGWIDIRGDYLLLGVRRARQVQRWLYDTSRAGGVHHCRR